MPQIPSVLIDILRLCLWLSILVVIFVPLERLFAVHPEKILRKGIFVDLGYYFLSSLLPTLLLSVPAALLAWAVHRVVPSFVLETSASLPLWARVAAGWWWERSAITGGIAGVTRFPSFGVSMRSTTAPSIATSW